MFFTSCSEWKTIAKVMQAQSEECELELKACVEDTYALPESRMDAQEITDNISSYVKLCEDAASKALPSFSIIFLIKMTFCRVTLNYFCITGLSPCYKKRVLNAPMGLPGTPC